jgi:ethanolaminephosphotransferase
MVPKQQEMDAVVKQIYEAMATKDYLNSTLLVLLGDHGMNDAGNHGGSAPGETSPALVFIAPKLKSISTRYNTPALSQDDFQYYSTVEQSDIAPTLGGLLGFPVPRNNLGAFISDFLPFWPNSKYLHRIQILLLNARQILSVITATFPSFEMAGPSQNCRESSDDVTELACEWRAITETLPAPADEDQDCEAWILSVTRVISPASGCPPS